MAVDYTAEGGTYSERLGGWEWWVNIGGYGHLHREGRPAVIYDDGSWRWYDRGYLHRLDGYAAYYVERDEYVWAVHGVTYDDEEEYLEACYEYRCKNGGSLTKGTLGANSN